MAVLPFKEGDEVLLCVDEGKYFNSLNGCRGTVESFNRNHYGRIQSITVRWTHIPPPPEVQRTTIKHNGQTIHLQPLHGRYRPPRPPASFSFKSALNQLKKAGSCDSCIHRMVHTIGQSCAGKSWKYAPVVIKKRLQQLKDR